MRRFPRSSPSLKAAGGALCAALWLCWPGAAGAEQAAAPEMPAVDAAAPMPVDFPFQAIDGGSPFQEMPPNPVPGAPNHLIVSGLETYDCIAPWTLAAPNRVDPASCLRLQGPEVGDTLNLTPAQLAGEASKAPWRRNYYGSFWLLNVVGERGEADLFSINHGENNGEDKAIVPKVRAVQWPTTVGPNIENTVGPVGDICTERNGCYYAFVGGSWMDRAKLARPLDETLTDYGPLVWPSAGYVTPDGKLKLSNGPRHPTALTKDGYVYVFYVDHRYSNGRDGLDKSDVGDRRSGVKVMRAKVHPPAAPAFSVYFNGAFDEPALPAGYSNDRTLDLVSAAGPRATPIFGPEGGGSKETLEFAAAHVRGTDLYLGVEQYEDYQNEGRSQCPGKSILALRLSRDLVHWSRRRDIYGCLSRQDFKMWYPRLVDEADSNSTEIDPANFNILGTALYERDKSGLRLYSMRIGLGPLGPAAPK